MRSLTLAILWLLLAPALVGQVRILATPEPLEVLRSIGVRGLGLWTLTICNDSPAPLLLSRERLQLALPNIRMVSNERARSVLMYYRGRRPAARAAQVLRYAAMGATIGAGFAGLPASAIAGLAIGTAGADQYSRILESQLPGLDPLVGCLINESMALGPGQCGTRCAFAALKHGAAPTETEIPGKGLSQ